MRDTNVNTTAPSPVLRPRANRRIWVEKGLTEDECRTLITTAKKRGGRYRLRDALAIRMCWRHGLRVSEERPNSARR